MTIKYDAHKAFQRAGFLSEDEEFRLAKLARSGDAAAMNRLVSAYEPFARGMAIRHKSKIEREDRVQIAMTALWQAATRFELARGRRLSAYAKFRIRRDLDDAGMRAASTLYLGNGKARRSAHQNVLRVCGLLGIDPTCTLTDEQAKMVADEIGVGVLDIRAVVETGDAAFTGDVDELRDDADAAELIEILDENEKRLSVLNDAITELDDMDAEIIRSFVLADKPKAVSTITKRYRSRLSASDAKKQAITSLNRAARRIAAQRGLVG